MATEVKVPVLGESITEGTLAEWLKQPGDAVAEDEAIASLETDKVSVEVTSPVAGVMGEHKVAAGETVAVGALIALIEEGGSAAATPADQAAEKSTNPPGPAETPLPRDDVLAPKAAALAAPAPESVDDDVVTTMSPAVRRAVLEHHLDPTKIKGTGRDGRLTKDDVLAAVGAQKGSTPAQAGAQAPQAKAPAIEAKAAPPGPRPSTGNRKEERVKMSRLRQTIAKRLKEAQNEAAILTTFNDVDMSAVIDARARYKDLFEKKHGIRLGFMGFFVKAVAL
ncbi:MAG: biotin/lipoyl-containing protein, partial [Sphingomicrobium sp.]